MDPLPATCSQLLGYLKGLAIVRGHLFWERAAAGPSTKSILGKPMEKHCLTEIKNLESLISEEPKENPCLGLPP